MSMLWINGAESALPVPLESDFGSLLKAVRKQMIAPDQIVSGIRVNGLPLEDNDEEDLGGIIVSELDTVEVQTQNPRVIATETLEALLEFGNQLSEISATCEEAADLRRLIDGIGIFVESLAQARIALNVRDCPEVKVQEDALAVILEALLATMNGLDEISRGDLLSHRIPQHFKTWSEQAIPALLRHSIS